MKDKEQFDNRKVSLEEGQELLKKTGMPDLTDLELQDLLENIKLFCELCYDIYKEKEFQHKMSVAGTHQDKFLYPENNESGEFNEAA